MDNIIIFYKDEISPQLEGITRILINQTEYSPGDGINKILESLVKETNWRYASLRVFKSYNDKYYISPDPVEINKTLSIIRKSDILDAYTKVGKYIRFVKE